jgi:flagellar basal-body rod modification protein FlgD
MQFNLSVPAASATVTISDESGKPVRTAQLAALASGDSSFTWDGRDNTGAALPAGTYSFSVQANSVTGASVAATTFTNGRIDGVSFINGTPVLTVGKAFVALSDLISVRGV